MTPAPVALLIANGESTIYLSIAAAP